jgi:hypothetical protein
MKGGQERAERGRTGRKPQQPDQGTDQSSSIRAGRSVIAVSRR